MAQCLAQSDPWDNLDGLTLPLFLLSSPSLADPSSHSLNDFTNHLVSWSYFPRAASQVLLFTSSSPDSTPEHSSAGRCTPRPISHLLCNRLLTMRHLHPTFPVILATWSTLSSLLLPVHALSNITFYSDSSCQTIIGEKNGPSDGTCTQFSTAGDNFGSFRVTSLDQTCSGIPFSPYPSPSQ